MTENATYKTIHLPMVAVYMATLGVLMVYYSTVTSLFIKNRTIQSMRRRSMLLTLLSVVFSEIITIFYLVAAPFRLFLSCSVSMWTAYLLMPASVLLLGSRMLNLAVMRRSHEAAVLRVEESVAAQEIDVQKQLAERQPGKLTNVEATSSNQMHPWATSNPGEDLENGKGHAWSTNNTNGQQQQQQRNTSGAYVSLSSPTATGGFPKSKQTFALNRWFLRHLNLFSVKALLIYFGIYLSVALIYAAIIQFVGIGNNTIGLSLSEWPRNGCEMRGEFYPLYALFFILIFIGLVSVILLLLRQTTHKDAQDMCNQGRELMFSVLSWIMAMGIYCAFVFTVGQEKGGDTPRIFPASNVIVIGCLLDHIFSVGWPTYRAHIDPNNIGWRSMLVSPAKHVKSVQVSGSRAQFHKLLSDPKRFREFKLFSIRNMSVENAFFYDACRSLLKSSELHEAALIENNADPRYRERLTRRLTWLHTTFLRSGADMEVNLLGNTRRRLERTARDGILDVPIMKKAMEEVEELMFYDTYQRYLRQHGDEADNDADNDGTTSVTEMTTVRP